MADQHNMRKLLVSEWVTLDGVFDADNMDQWWLPYDSVERQEYIQEGILASDAILLGGTTYEMLAPYWSTQKNDENGPAAKLNSVRKYVVSSFSSAHYHRKWKAFLQRRDVYDEAEACQNQNVQLRSCSALLPASKKLNQAFTGATSAV